MGFRAGRGTFLHSIHAVMVEKKRIIQMKNGPLVEKKGPKSTELKMFVEN